MISETFGREIGIDFTLFKEIICFFFKYILGPIRPIYSINKENMLFVKEKKEDKRKKKKRKRKINEKKNKD